jgi:hypothetical protein
VDVNKRTARLASIIPLITQDYVPQSFVDVNKDDYLKATIVFYELNDARPLAELYCWAYRRSCLHFDTSVQVVGFDEIAARYRPLRRALVAELVRSLVPPERVTGFIEARRPMKSSRNTGTSSSKTCWRNSIIWMSRAWASSESPGSN